MSWCVIKFPEQAKMRGNRYLECALGFETSVATRKQYDSVDRICSSL